MVSDIPARDGNVANLFYSVSVIDKKRKKGMGQKKVDFFFIDRYLALIFYYFFLYTVFVCKFRPHESQSNVLGDLRRMISLVVGSYFGMPPLLLTGLHPLESRLC